MGKKGVLDLRPVQVCYLCHRSWDTKRLWLCALPVRQGIVRLNNDPHYPGDGKGGQENGSREWWWMTALPQHHDPRNPSSLQSGHKQCEIETQKQKLHRNIDVKLEIPSLLSCNWVLKLTIFLFWGLVLSGARYVTPDSWPTTTADWETVNLTIFYKSTTHWHQWDVGSEPKPDQDWNNWTFIQKQREHNS